MESFIVFQFVGSFRSLHFPAVHIRGHCLQQIQPTFKHNTIQLLLPVRHWQIICGTLPLPQAVPALFKSTFVIQMSFVCWNKICQKTFAEGIREQDENNTSYLPKKQM